MERKYFLVICRSDSSEPIAVSRLHASTDGSVQWQVSADDGSGDGSRSLDDLRRSFKANFASWLDTLGQESAQAQQLKQAVTSWEKLRPDGMRAYRVSVSNCTDTIFLLIEEQEDGEPSFQATALLRLGNRRLFLEQEGQLVQHDSVLSVLDFYCREQRKGFGLLLMSQALSHLSTSAARLAFDRPSPAMLAFLCKHFGLIDARRQHNNFVIFDDFFKDASV